MANRVQRLEIAGGIGAGKTTLASILAEAAGAQLVAEDVLAVPFFAEFYAAPQVYGFEKNISFLLSHADQLRKALAGQPQSPIICDFALFQDLSYTDISCDAYDVAAVEAVYERLVARVSQPDIVLHLRCTPDTLLQRIGRRGRDEERGISRAYLAHLCAAVDHRLEELRRAAPEMVVMEVDTEASDYAADPLVAQGFVARVLRKLSEPFRR